MRNIVALLILFFFLFTSSCNNQKISSQCDLSLQKPSEKTVLEASPENMREVLVEAYRLRPDKRFLLAVAEVHHFLSGQDKESVSAEFRDGHWEICYRNIIVGVLPEFPDFPDFMVLLSNWVKVLHQEYPLNLDLTSSHPSQGEIDSQLNQFLAPNLASAARQVDILWNKGSHYSTLLYSATRALVFLALQGMDRLETADLLPAKALALLTLTKTLTDYQVVREESLLAYTMGYSAHSITIGKKLHQSDPVHLYVTHDDQPLMKIAEDKDGTIEARYLYLLRLAELRDVESLISWVNSYFSDTWHSLPVFKASLELRKFAINPIFSKALPRLILLELDKEVGVMPDLVKLAKNTISKSYSAKELKAIIIIINKILRDETTTLVDHFESRLDILNKKYPGPFLDSRTYQSYYQGYFFSAFYILGLHYLDSLSSLEAANQFAAILGQDDIGIAADFQRWYRNLAKSKAGKTDPTSLIDDLLYLPNFGAPPLMRTLDEQKKYFKFGDPDILRAVKRLTLRMDSRIGHRRYLGYMAYTNLLDLKLAEKLYRGILQTAPSQHEKLQVWYANFTGNQKRLQELLHSPNFKPEAQAKILGYLENQKGIRHDFIQSEYLRLINENPDNWNLRSKYVDYLEGAKNYPEARTVINDWLKRKVFSAGLEHIVARTLISRMYYKEGRYEDGWVAIKPVVDSQQAGVMRLAALLLDKLGRNQDAEKMAQAVVSRYPGSFPNRAFLAEFYWRHDKYSQAAKLLKSSPHRISMDDWQFVIAPKFTDVFIDRPKEKALAAFSALLEQKFGHFELLRISFPIAKAGKNELAFDLVSQLRSSGMGNMVFLIHSYRYLKAWKGKQHALGWLRKKIPSQMLNPASMIIYRQKEFGLLWELIEHPEQGQHADFVWLMRAAASARQSMENDPHRETLLEYYNKRASGYYHTLGRFLLGLTPEKEVLSIATDAKKRCEIAYYIGLKAQGEGRYEDASDWFRVAIETGLINNGEYRWAYDTLYNWQAKGKSLEQLVLITDVQIK